MKKEILTRILELNNSTDAIKESPHKIEISEIENSLNRRKKMLFYFHYPILALLLITSIYLHFVNPENLFLVTIIPYKLIPLLAFSKAFSMATKQVTIERIKEQLFLQSLLDRNEI